MFLSYEARRHFFVRGYVNEVFKQKRKFINKNRIIVGCQVDGMHKLVDRLKKSAITYVEKEAGSFGDKLLPLDAFDSITHALIVHNLTQPGSC